MEKEKTEFEDPEKEEQIINIEKIQNLFSFYKIPLVFAFLAIFLLGGAVIIWQSNKESAKITFSEETKESTQIKADIEGAVVNPGVYQLSSSSRIQDLLILAGGLSAEADREWIAKNLNLAARLTDGGKVYIPKVGESTTSTTSTTGSGVSLISINNARASELESLPGIGPVTAQKIIAGRPYQTIEELLNRKIVSKSTFEKIKDQLTL